MTGREGELDTNDGLPGYAITPLDVDTMSGMDRTEFRREAERWHRESATLPEIARAMGLTPEALFRLERNHASFPMPVAAYGRTRVYLIDEVTDFHLGVGRIYGKRRSRA